MHTQCARHLLLASTVSKNAVSLLHIKKYTGRHQDFYTLKEVHAFIRQVLEP